MPDKYMDSLIDRFIADLPTLLGEHNGKHIVYGSRRLGPYDSYQEASIESARLLPDEQTILIREIAEIYLTHRNGEPVSIRGPRLHGN